jgi:hypothetical protein
MLDLVTLAGIALGGCALGLALLVVTGRPDERPPGPWRR